MERIPEPEAMDILEEARAYADADFAEVNDAFVEALTSLAGRWALGDRVRAVDLGTGPGDIPIRLSRRRPGWQIVALDVSEAMLAIAAQAAERAGLADRIEWVLADAKGSSLPAGTFDVLLSNSILHHLTDTASFWAELRRLARPGAGVFLRDLCRPASPAAARRLVETHAGGESALLQEEFHRSLLAAFTVEEVVDQLQAAGLGGLAVQQVTDRHLDVYGRLGGEGL